MPGMLTRVTCFVILSFVSFTPAMSANYPRGFEAHPFNGGQPVVGADGTVTFQILDRECSNVVYGDGRGEFDCKNGNVRTSLAPLTEQRMGQSIEYRFDLWVDPAIAYPGFLNPMSAAFLPGGWDSYLRVASWEGNALHNFLYSLKIDTKRGVTFLGQRCQAPEDFGQWVSFSMKIRWSADSTGWIKVSCDDRIIHAAEGLATDQAPHCYIRNHCEPGVVKHPSRITFLPGLVMQGHGFQWKEIGEASAFTDIQPEGITVKMRGLEVVPRAVLYDPDDVEVVKRLQARLNELGCDVGAVDGVAGRKTREAAIGCRQFPEGQMPRAFNVATARQFVELYESAGAADLPSGTATARPAYRIRVAEDFSGHDGRSAQVVSKFNGVVQREGKPDEAISFGLLGYFNYSRGTFVNLELEFSPNLGRSPPAALAACSGHRIERWDDGSTHLVLAMRPSGNGFKATSASCVIDALPQSLAAQVGFVLDNFQQVALSMVEGGSAQLVRNEGARTFIERASRGEVTLGR